MTWNCWGDSLEKIVLQFVEGGGFTKKLIYSGNSELGGVIELWQFAWVWMFGKRGPWSVGSNGGKFLRIGNLDFGGKKFREIRAFGCWTSLRGRPVGLKRVACLKWEVIEVEKGKGKDEGKIESEMRAVVDAKEALSGRKWFWKSWEHGGMGMVDGAKGSSGRKGLW